MKKENKNVVSIIGGADGPTSIFLAGRSGKKSLKMRIQKLGKMNNIPKPDIYNEDAVKEFFDQLQARSEVIAKIPDSEISMDFHIYEIKIDDNYLEMEIDYIWNVFQISYSGNLEKVAQDLYLYYGVSEDDIRERTERYSSLLAVLSA